MARTRQTSWNGGQPFTYLEIQTLASLERICYSEDIEELVFFIPRMDTVYLQYQRDKQAAAKPKPKGGSK